MKLQKVLESVAAITFVMLAILVSDGKAAVSQGKALSGSHLDMHTKAKPSIAEASSISVSSHQQMSRTLLFLSAGRISGGGLEAPRHFVPGIRSRLKLTGRGEEVGRVRKGDGGQLG